MILTLRLALCFLLAVCVFGLHATHSEHLAIGAFFTAVSLVRSYCLRRLFNHWSHR